MRASYVHVSNRHQVRFCACGCRARLWGTGRRLHPALTLGPPVRTQIEELRGPVAGEDHEVDIVSTGMRVRPGRDTKGPSPVVESDDDGHSVAQASWRKDKWGIALLLVLYTLQGIPMGLSNAVPFMLMERGASYSDQAKFSLVSWPYATKVR